MQSSIRRGAAGPLSVPNLLLPLLLPLLLLALALPLPAAAQDSTKYDLARFRPFRCFAVDLMDWEAGELNHAYNAVPDIRYLKADLSFDDDKLTAAAEAGAAFLKARGGTLEALVGARYDRVLAPPPSFTEADYARVNHATPVVHFRYCRELARGLVCCAAHAFRAGRGEAAWRFLNAAIRFGHAVRGGDGDPPTLIQGMIGIALVNIGAGPFAWQVLGEAELTADQLRTIAGEIDRTLAEWLPFVRIAKSEYHFVANTIRNDLFKPELWADQSDRTLGDVMTKIPLESRSRAVELTLARVDSVYDRTFAILDTDEAGMVGAADLLRELGEEVGRRGSPSLAMILSPMEAVGDILLAIAYPNFGRAQIRDAEARMRLVALASGARMLATLRDLKSDGLPEEEEARRLLAPLPVDAHTGTREVALALRDGTLLLYSVGENGRDDGGSVTDDLILFALRGAASPR